MGEDTTDVGRALKDSDVTLLSPVGSPGVLNEPVRGGSVVVTGNQDTVVELLSTVAGDNTTIVELP